MKEIIRFQKNARKFRKEQSLTQPALAAKAGLSRFVIIDMERKEEKNPQLSTAIKISRALGKSIDEMIES